MPADLLALGLAAALAAEPVPGAEEAPPVALLEFLGMWTTDDGVWVDPEVLDSLPEMDEAPAAGGKPGGEDPPAAPAPSAGTDAGGTP